MGALYHLSQSKQAQLYLLQCGIGLYIIITKQANAALFITVWHGALYHLSQSKQAQLYFLQCMA